MIGRLGRRRGLLRGEKGVLSGEGNVDVLPLVVLTPSLMQEVVSKCV